HEDLLHCFKSIASASDGVRGKPAPDLYLLAVGKLRDLMAVDAASCVAIEDSKWGLEAAHKAGLRTVAATHTYPASELRDAALVRSRCGQSRPDDCAARMRPPGSGALSASARWDGRGGARASPSQRLPAGCAHVGKRHRRAERVSVRRGRLHRQSEAL